MDRFRSRHRISCSSGKQRSSSTNSRHRPSHTFAEARTRDVLARLRGDPGGRPICTLGLPFHRGDCSRRPWDDHKVAPRAPVHPTCFDDSKRAGSSIAAAKVSETMAPTPGTDINNRARVSQRATASTCFSKRSNSRRSATRTANRPCAIASRLGCPATSSRIRPSKRAGVVALRHHQFEGRLPFAAGARPVTPSSAWPCVVSPIRSRPAADAQKNPQLS
jgi:hypothetical protein